VTVQEVETARRVVQLGREKGKSAMKKEKKI